MTHDVSRNLTITLLDGYTDEPSTLGVPPYIAQLPRYIYGAIKSVNKAHDINYMTIDEYRTIKEGNFRNNGVLKNKSELFKCSNVLIVISGAIVPGKYLSGTPISINEIIELGEHFEGTTFIGGAQIGCKILPGIKEADIYDKKKRVETHFDFIIEKDLDAGVFDQLCTGEPSNRYRTINECKAWSLLGSMIINQHPNFPRTLMVELEAGRGCVRYHTGGCSFCSEPKFGEPVFRPPKDIIAEVSNLYRHGARHFRLGALSDLFSYWSTSIGETETPKPNPEIVGKLLTGIRRSAPKLRILHLDNANPAVMATNWKETIKILKLIIGNCTSGNVLSFGLESADPEVIRANNLNTNPKEVFEMLKLVNKYGSGRGASGLPELLPGLNFVYGLKGESKNTFRLNFDFLSRVLNSGFLLRRINLRQVIPTNDNLKQSFNIRKYHKQFVKHKKLIREQIDRPMLKRICPLGTMLADVYFEKQTGNVSFGRQLGTYPLLVGVPYKLTLNEFHNIAITDWGYRSVTGFSTPFKINQESISALQALPGIGKKRAVRIVRGRPIGSVEELNQILDDYEIDKIVERNLSFDL